MNTDIRVSVDFWDHHKTQKLIKRLGLAGPIALQRLWMYAAKYRPEGELYGMDQDDILFAAQFKGRSSKFVGDLVELGWLDLIDGTHFLHDWHDHNPWACGAKDRSNAARFSRMAKTHPEIYEELKAEGRSEVSREEYDKLISKQGPVNEPLTLRQGPVNERLTNDLTPAPAPAPAPAPKEKTKTFAGSENGNRRERYPDDFEQAWKNHGRQDGSKHKACQKWLELKRIKVLPDLPVILSAQNSQKRSQKWRDGYVPYFLTWLNQRRWEEETSNQAGKPLTWGEKKEAELAARAQATGTEAAGDVYQDYPEFLRQDDGP